MSVEVLLATYQGEKYIDEQISSILQQTYSDFKLIIRDDGSQDKTYLHLQKWAAKDPRILLLPQGVKLKLAAENKSLANAQGSTQNFVRLMNHSEADFIFFSDQDDLWHPQKMELMLNEMKALNPTLPAIVHSDLEVVNEKNGLVHPSFWKMNQFNIKEGNSFSHLLIQNTVTGCAMLMNRATLLKAKEIPQEAIQHDWWLALIASSMGKVIPISQPLVRYRQHANNAVGAKKHSLLMHPKTLLQKLKAKRYLANLAQAQSFYDRFVSDLPKASLEVLKAYLSLPSLNYFQSRKTILKYRLFKQGGLRRFIHFFLSYK